jgi:hypothetical protein
MNRREEVITMKRVKRLTMIAILFLSFATALTHCGGGGGGGSGGGGGGGTPPGPTTGTWDSAKWDNALWGP